ncbi:MAG: endonuclease domain-containing protein [Acidimicrobiales bacterium]
MSADAFCYDGYELDRTGHRLVCRYSLGARRFAEEITFEVGDVDGHGDGHGTGARAARAEPSAAPAQEAVRAAARLVHLLAGVSYYKTAAPPLIDLGDLATTPAERRFLRDFYVDGLGEFAFRNGRDLSSLEIAGPELSPSEPVTLRPRRGRPLVPFGAGIDSIVTVESVRTAFPDASLFVVSRGGDRFAAIERAAAATTLPVVRAARTIDPALLRSEEHGFLNGHVPVTGVLSAIAVMAAVLGGHDAVVMSNERSASVPTIDAGGARVNHQWSKSLAFEAPLRDLLAQWFAPAPDYFSFLRARSELWVAQRFATLERYHPVFCSCNRAFSIDRARRLDEWCGTCDKCCFIDLVLAPFLPPDALAAIFRGREPLADPSLADRFRSLLGGQAAKPFECVGDEEECRSAVLLAAARADRDRCALLQALAAEVRAGWPGDAGTAAARHFERDGIDFVPAEYAGA